MEGLTPSLDLALRHIEVWEKKKAELDDCDAILCFRVGGHFEAYYEDARRIVARGAKVRKAKLTGFGFPVVFIGEEQLQEIANLTRSSVAILELSSSCSEKGPVCRVPQNNVTQLRAWAIKNGKWGE